MSALTRKEVFDAYKAAWDRAFSDANWEVIQREVIASLRKDLLAHRKLLQEVRGELVPDSRGRGLARKIDRLLEKSKERGL